ncbi:MAG: beta-1,6-N-acetylglucosaminyltransferase [Chlorobiaceae bacterium]|nr:beta-1,6-N-acetylglucosaminyltransferase [Chlorobiaceae bacterium]
MRIAVLILVHKCDDQVVRLIEHLSEDFDVFVHIDRKAKCRIVSRKENVFVYSKYNVYWGSYSLILAPLFLLRKAYGKKYDQYVLISGQDVPLKSNREIIEYFSNNRGNEYIEYYELPRDIWSGNGGLDRIHYFHEFSKRRIEGGKAIDWFVNKMQNRIFSVLNKAMRSIGFRRNIPLKIYGGSNWINITHACLCDVLRFLNDHRWYLKKFRYTHCADEIFFQTIILNLQHARNVCNDSLRYVDWASGPEFPRVLRTVDGERIISSNALFARKFDPGIDADIIDGLYEKIKS